MTFCEERHLKICENFQIIIVGYFKIHFERNSRSRNKFLNLIDMFNLRLTIHYDICDPACDDYAQIIKITETNSSNSSHNYRVYRCFPIDGTSKLRYSLANTQWD